MVCVALRCPGKLAKDLTFKAKAKDSKFVLEDMPRTTTLPHCSMLWTTRIMPDGWITVHLEDKAPISSQRICGRQLYCTVDKKGVLINPD